MAYDFKQHMKIDAAERPALESEYADAEWARFGRNMHRNMLDERFVKAIMTAMVTGGTATSIARKIRAYMLTGTISR